MCTWRVSNAGESRSSQARCSNALRTKSRDRRDFTFASSVWRLAADAAAVALWRRVAPNAARRLVVKTRNRVTEEAARLTFGEAPRDLARIDNPQAGESLPL